jgi:glycosyltransferase involved in cell wall biosynthesis
MVQTLPTLDIVVPCYNEADTISACLEGLLKQSDQIARIIIVDNNSTDKTVEIIKQYQKTNKKIDLLTESKQGVQFARNTGLDAAESDVIARIDADTIVLGGWAQAIRSYYAKRSDVGASSGFSWYYDLPGKGVTQFFTQLFSHFANEKLGDSHLIYGSNMTIRRSTWQKIHHEVCMINGIMEDQDLGYHVKQSGDKTGYIPAAKAKVSGRRMRMSPLRYWRYNKQWWMTYANHGEKLGAFKIRMMVWLGNVLQALAWVLLQVHDPATNRFSVAYLFERRHERQIP